MLVSYALCDIHYSLSLFLLHYNYFYYASCILNKHTFQTQVTASLLATSYQQFVLKVGEPVSLCPKSHGRKELG